MNIADLLSSRCPRQNYDAIDQETDFAPLPGMGFALVNWLSVMLTVKWFTCLLISFTPGTRSDVDKKQQRKNAKQRRNIYLCLHTALS